MVKSRISLQDVVYKEDTCIDLADKSKELVQYIIPLFEFPRNVIALGNKCIKYEKKGIIYHHCYLITEDKGVRIGVFEFPSNHYESYLEHKDSNEIMCSKLLPHLLLFDNARDEVMRSIHHLNAGKTLGTLEPYKQARLALPHVETVPFSLDMVKPDIELSGKPSSDDYLGISGLSYLPKKNLVECISHSIHKYLKQTENETTIYLYGILADHITVSMFDTLKTMFTILDEKLLQTKEKHKEIKKELSALKKNIKHAQQQDTVFQETMENIKTLKQQSQHLSVSQKYIQHLLNDKEYMRYLDTLEDFKMFIKSGGYTCEPWAIEIFERLMNIKLLLLSKDMPQWLVCSRQSPFPHNMSLFNPMYYILLEFTDNDYRVIEVNGAPLLSFEVIPLKIKDLVVNRCLEYSEGVYANMPLFVKYKQFKLTKEQRKNLIEEPLNVEPDKDKLLIGDDLKNYMYPGCVQTEKIDFDTLVDSNLVRDKQWREKLSDSYIKPDGRFRLGDKEWASVNHYVTAQQLKTKDPKKCEKLSITNGSTLSKKPIPYMLLDNDDRYSAQFAKFSQNPPLKDILLDTNDAQLYMYVPGKPHIKLDMLEKVRQVLQK